MKILDGRVSLTVKLDHRLDVLFDEYLLAHKKNGNRSLTRIDVMNDAIQLFLATFPTGGQREVVVGEYVCACTCKMPDELYQALRLRGYQANRSHQELFTMALDAYLSSTGATPERLRRRGSYIYLVGPAAHQSMAVKVGKTGSLTERLRQYQSKCPDLGGLAVWELDGEDEAALTELEVKVLRHLGVGAMSAGGMRVSANSVVAHGVTHTFPFNTYELLAMPRHEAVQEVDKLVVERAVRVL